MPGTADAGLDLIEHQQPVAPVAPLAHRAQIARRRQLHAALALDRLHQDGHDALPVILVRLIQRGEVAERHFQEVPWQGAEAQAHRRAVAGRQGAEGAAVKGVFHDQHQGVLDTFLPAVQSRQLQRGFIGFGPGIAEERPLQA